MNYSFEKVNPKHPDKIADRIAGAIVDAAYAVKENPIVAVEVLIGHGKCYIINETDTPLLNMEVESIVHRIAGNLDTVIYNEVEQDSHLADNQKRGMRCGDNGIFKGVHTEPAEIMLAAIAQELYSAYDGDGKYIINISELAATNPSFVICQSNADSDEIRRKYGAAVVNPLGDWTGGIDVDCGATNRKLGSDMGRAVTGGGLHGKDLSKADVTISIYAHLKAQETGHEVNLSCAIGDSMVDGKPYSELVEIARKYIKDLGGFEKFAEWGLIRPADALEIRSSRIRSLARLVENAEDMSLPHSDTRPEFAREIPKERLEDIPAELFKDDSDKKYVKSHREINNENFRFESGISSVHLSEIVFEKNGEKSELIPSVLVFDSVHELEYTHVSCNLGGNWHKCMIKFKCTHPDRETGVIRRIYKRLRPDTCDEEYATFLFGFDDWYRPMYEIVRCVGKMLAHWDYKMNFGFGFGERIKAVKAFKEYYEYHEETHESDDSIEDKI